MEVKYYYCDVCGVIIPEDEVRSISIKFAPDTDSEYKRIELCNSCYQNAIKGINSYNKDTYKKEKLINILKLWIFKKGSE